MQPLSLRIIFISLTHLLNMYNEYYRIHCIDLYHIPKEHHSQYNRLPSEKRNYPKEKLLFTIKIVYSIKHEQKFCCIGKYIFYHQVKLCSLAHQPSSSCISPSIYLLTRLYINIFFAPEKFC